MTFEDVFVDHGALIGEPDSYWKSQVQACYLPQCSANFQGVGAHVYEYGLDYLQERHRGNNEFVQLHVADANIHLTTAALLLAETAELYRERRYPAAFDLSCKLRAYSQVAVGRCIEQVQAECGSPLSP